MQEQSATTDLVPKLFHSGKVLRTPRYSNSSRQQQQHQLLPREKKVPEQCPPKEITSEEDYWSFRTIKLQQQRSESSTKKTCLDIYSNVAHSLKNNSTLSIDKENLAPNANEVNTQLFKGLVFFFNSIRGSGANSQYNLVKLASVHGANVL